MSASPKLQQPGLEQRERPVSREAARQPRAPGPAEPPEPAEPAEPAEPPEPPEPPAPPEPTEPPDWPEGDIYKVRIEGPDGETIYTYWPVVD